MADNTDANNSNVGDGKDRATMDSNNAYDHGISIGSIVVIAAMICCITAVELLERLFLKRRLAALGRHVHQTPALRE
jgi:hypothetical protein